MLASSRLRTRQRSFDLLLPELQALADGFGLIAGEGELDGGFEGGSAQRQMMARQTSQGPPTVARSTFACIMSEGWCGSGDSAE